MKRVADLSLPIFTGMPAVPGSDRFVVVKHTMTFDSKYNRTASSLSLHSQLCSTHIDAPIHVIPDGYGIDRYSLTEQLIGPAHVLDLQHVPPGHRVSVSDLEDAVKRSGHPLRPGCMLAINTGWTDRAWGKPEFFDQMITLEAPSVGYWIAEKAPRALMTDSYNDSWEKFFDHDWALNHIPLLSRGIPLIEFCTNLSAMKEGEWEVYALPLKILDCDGSPSRVIAVAQ